MTGRPAMTRTTESSTRRTIGRSCPRTASAIGPSRTTASWSSVTIGSSPRLPLVATTAKPRPASN
jgi:hypothetical protein